MTSLGSNDDTPEPKPVGRDTSDRLIVAAARRITGEHKAMRHSSAVKPILIGVAIALGGSLAGWLGKSVWGGVKADITAGKADISSVESVKMDVGILKTDVATLKIDVKDQVRRQKVDGRITRSIARKLRIDLPPEPKDE